MDRNTDTPDDRPTRGRRAPADRVGDDLRALVGAPEATSSAPGAPRDADLQALVGPGASAPGAVSTPSSGSTSPADADLARMLGPAPVRGPEAASSPALSDLVGAAPASAPKVGTELTELVGVAVPRTDDRGWMAPERAQAARRPRFARAGSGGSVGALSIVVAVAAVLMLAGTTTFALVQRATVNPAAEAMAGLREREAELRNEIKGLQTSSDLLAAMIEEAQVASQSAAGVLPNLRGRVEDAPVDAAESARTALDSAVSSVPTVLVPDYQRGTVDEQSLRSVGHALDEVRRERDALPSLIAQVRTARSGVSSALDDFRARLRDLGAAVEAAGARVVQSQDAAGDGFRQAVTNAAAGVLSAQRTGADGLTEMAAFAAAVDALNAENARVLEQQSVRAPSRAPSGGTVSPTTPVAPGGTGATDPTTPAPTDPGTGGTDQPSPSPSDSTQPGGASTP